MYFRQQDPGSNRIIKLIQDLKGQGSRVSLAFHLVFS